MAVVDMALATVRCVFLNESIVLVPRKTNSDGYVYGRGCASLPGPENRLSQTGLAGPDTGRDCRIDPGPTFSVQNFKYSYSPMRGSI